MDSFKRSFSIRLLCMFLTAWIVFCSCFFSYQKTCECAEWVAGVVATIGGAPLLTALAIGGVVVAGGVAIYELSQTDVEDYRDFYNGVKTGFNEFVAEQETIIAKEQDASLSDQEASDIGVAVAREKVNNFFSSAVDSAKSTVTGIKYDVMKYWQLYNNIVGKICDGQIDVPDAENGVLPVGTQLTSVYIDGENYFSGIYTYSQSGTQVMDIDGHNYIVGGRYVGVSDRYDPMNTQKPLDIVNGIMTEYNGNSALAIPFLTLSYTGSNGYSLGLSGLKVSSLGKTSFSSSDFIQGQRNAYSFGPTWNKSQMIEIAKLSGFPLVCRTEWASQNLFQYVGTNYQQILAINNTGSAAVKEWHRTIKQTYTNTKIGNAIQTGRKQLVNNGDWVGSIFQEDSVPVTKTGINVNEGVVSGTLGWSVPNAGVYDDVFLGNRPYSDVVDGLRSVGVPTDSVTGVREGDTVVEYPEDTPVQDTSDYPKEDTDKPQEIPDKPQNEVFESQGGSYYPTALDLTNIFPFCIPFDIIYLVNQYSGVQEKAPVIEYEIEYPEQLKPAMGDSYTVTIDFADFVTVRNVLRVFILLLFIAGLMKITRDIIRG